MNPKLLTGEEAKAKLNLLLSSGSEGVTIYQLKRKGDFVMGYYFEDNLWYAFDNSAGECFVESFKTERKAKLWLER